MIDPSVSKIVSFATDACEGTANEINYLEHIEVITTVRYSRRGALQIQLTSPQGYLLFHNKVKRSDMPICNSYCSLC